MTEPNSIDDVAHHDDRGDIPNDKDVSVSRGGVRGFLKKFSFGDLNVFGSEDGDDGDDDIVQKDTSVSPSSSNRSPKSPLRRALSFGKRQEAGLHGGAGIRWYRNLFPLNQKFEPRVEYPLWDEDWDSNQTHRKKFMAELAAGQPTCIVTRHIFLIRHGQYNEHPKEDENKILTPIGRQQAKWTGERIAKIIQHNNTEDGRQNRVNVFAVSDMTRAKQTADIIYKELETTYEQNNREHSGDLWNGLTRLEPDPLLNEGFPVHTIPGPTGFRDLHTTDVDRDFPRVEEAFLKYIGTSTWLQKRKDSEQKQEQLRGSGLSEPSPANSHQCALNCKHEYEIIVGHANVTRYFICRALQIPPECWLRMSLFHCSISYLVVTANGHVTARMIGDIGHIPYEETSVDGTIQGFNWE